MKIYISADIEGVAGIADWSEGDKSKPDYDYFRRQMTAEVAAACEGANAAGATEILVKDAHHTGRNIDPSKLPDNVRLVRGWSGHPQAMMDMLDSSFAAALFIGYHSRGGSAGNPLSHTMHPRAQEVRINGVPASEFMVNSTTAAMHQVPVPFLSGDEALCDEAERAIAHLKTVRPLSGRGSATVSMHPQLACQKIREGVRESLSGDLTSKRLALPTSFEVVIEYREPHLAYGRAFYPGVTLSNERFMHYESRDWFEVLRMLLFVL